MGSRLLDLAIILVPFEEQYKKVRDYVNNNREWDWNCFASYLMNAIILSIASIRVPCDEDGDDFLYWGTSKTGHFTIKYAFDLVDGHRWDEDHPKWKVVWKWRGPERVNSFLWLVMNDKLLTNMERVRRHMTDIAMCGRYHVDSEVVLHVLRDYHFSTQIWLGLVPQE